MGIFGQAQTTQKPSQRYIRMARCRATCGGHAAVLFLVPCPTYCDNVLLFFFLGDSNFGLLRGTSVWSDFAFAAVAQRAILTGCAHFG